MERRKPDEISQEDWDAVASPPLSPEFIAKMKPAREAAPELIALQEKIEKQRGRPKAVEKKTSTTIRLSPNVIAHFKKKGPGWQTRLNAALEAIVARERPPRLARKRAARKSVAQKVARKRA